MLQSQTAFYIFYPTCPSYNAVRYSGDYCSTHFSDETQKRSDVFHVIEPGDV